MRFDGKVHVEGAKPAARLDSLDVAGVLVGEDAVLFHSEPGLLRSAFSFDTGAGVKASTLRFTITGVAPGIWEIWRNGWVVDIGVRVREREAVLHFSERPGSYFIRRLN